MTYIISYFAVNFMLLGKIFSNLYFTPHTEKYKKEQKEDMDFFIPLTLLFGAVLLVIAYIEQNIDGE
jgi:hypothetical protein